MESYLFSSLKSCKKDTQHPGFIKSLFSILAHYPAEFLEERTHHYLFKLTNTNSLLKKYISSSNIKNNQRNIFFKLLAVKFKTSSYAKKVLGISISFDLFSEYEKLEFKHFSKILKRLIPGAYIIEDSFYLNFYQKNKCICYFEIEKIRGKNLNFHECLKIKNLLRSEIKESIEFVSPNLFAPINEEEIFRSILRLNKEVTSHNDIPHVIISFQEQNFNTIKFNIILLRILKPNGASIKHLLNKLQINAQIQIEETTLLKDNYTKETTVFSLEIKNSLFFRKNYSVDLLKARQYICLLLENIIGELRDFNGGLLSKQSEQFDLIKKNLSTKIRNISVFEELFYSLRPSNVQLLISNKIALELCKKFYEIKDKPLNDHAVIDSFQSKEAFFFVIKTGSDLFDSIFTNLPSNNLLAKSVINIDQLKYHCLIQINPPDSSLLDFVSDKFLKLAKRRNLNEKNELRIPFQHFPPSLHPYLSSDIRSLTLCKALFEGLTRITPDETIQLAVAENVKISSCKRFYTFKLKPSKWSNGEDLNSYHFARSWKKAISPNSNCIRLKNFFIIKNAQKAYKGIISVDDVGIYTPSRLELVVELEYPASYFLQLIADPIFSPLYGADINEEPTIFNGPFLISSYKTNQQIELLTNKLYWDERNVKLKKITIYLMQDSDQSYNAYKKGELDWIGEPLSSLPSEFRNSKNIHSYESNFPFWLFCNTTCSNLKSKNIRKALSLAINRKNLLKQILPFQKPSYNIIPEKFSSIKKSEMNMRKAAYLFKKGLKELNLEKSKFEIKLSHSSSFEQKEIANFLKNSWEQALNIKVNLIENNWNTYWNTVFNYEYEIAGFFLCSTYEGLSHFLDFFESSYNNFAKWENDNYKKYVTLAKHSSDKEHSMLALKKAETILNDEMPVIPLYNSSFFYFKNKNIKNLDPPKFGYIDFKWVCEDD